MDEASMMRVDGGSIDRDEVVVVFTSGVLVERFSAAARDLFETLAIKYLRHEGIHIMDVHNTLILIVMGNNRT